MTSAPTFVPMCHAMGDTLVLGPMALPVARVATVASVALFLALASRATARGKKTGANAAIAATIAGLVVARLAFVVEHFGVYGADPASMLAVWQGGFEPLAGLFAAAAALVLMLRRTRLLTPALLSLAAAAGCWEASTMLIGCGQRRPFPHGLTVFSLDGQPVPLDSLKGRPFVLNLWASWCPPCRRELPMLMQARTANPHVPILLINQGEDAARIAAFLRGRGLGSTGVLIDPAQSVGRAIGSMALPTTIFVRGTEIRRVNPGELPRATFDDAINDLEKTE